MKGGNKLFIFTGVALALVTVLLAITMTSGGNDGIAQDDTKPSDKVKVVKAAADFEPHKVISMSDILVEEMRADEVPDGAATDSRLVLGQSYKLGAVKGDILLTTYLEPPGITNSIAAGMRAVSLEADNQNMMSGLIMDGDYVDIVFEARVDLQRVLQAGAVEVEEDGPYTIKEVVAAEPGEEVQEVQGSDGSEFVVKDGGANLEPVAKMIVQNVKVLRVVKPGVSYDGQGQEVSETADGTVSAAGNGQLIVEVTPQQAEVLAFIEDDKHSFEVVVRGKDDHEIARTSGITFEILMTERDWSMPWPQPVVAPGGEE